MKIVELHFYLLVFCGAAEGFREMLVDLGQNVTLQCEVDVKNVDWFLMKPSEPPVFILRSFSSRSLRAKYNNTTFNRTFSLQYNSSLFIHNVSTNELGVYYCIQTGSPSNIISGIRLYIRNHSAGSIAPCHFENQTCEVEKKQNQTADQSEDIRFWRSLFIILGIINCAVIVVVTGFTVHYCRRATKSQAQPADAHVQLHQNNPDPEYADVQFSTMNSGVRMTNLNSTYALLQPPNPE